MKKQSPSLIVHNLLKVGIAVFAGIVVTPIALLFASSKRIIQFYLKSKIIVARYVKKAKKKMVKD